MGTTAESTCPINGFKQKLFKFLEVPSAMMISHLNSTLKTGTVIPEIASPNLFSNGCLKFGSDTLQPCSCSMYKYSYIEKLQLISSDCYQWNESMESDQTVCNASIGPKQHSSIRSPCNNTKNAKKEYCYQSKFSWEYLKDIMGMMQFAKHMYDKDDVKDLYEGLRNSSIPYSLYTWDWIELMDHYVRWKNYHKLAPKSAGLLSPKPTSNGICLSWTPSNKSIFKDSKYQQIFKEVFEPKDWTENVNEDTTLSFRIYLDKHESYIPFRMKTFSWEKSNKQSAYT